MRRATRWFLALWLMVLLSACADRQDAIDAATELVEVTYPGQLELVDTRLQKDHFDVVFAIKGDPFTRIRFGVDRDASRCRPGSPCEERLHRAYVAGVSAGTKLRALNEGLSRCGVVPLGVQDGDNASGFTAVIELDLAARDQQPALDRLSSCLAAFRSALPPDATVGQRSLTLRILLPKAGKEAHPSSLLTFETRLADERAGEISYLIGIGPDDADFLAENLRINPAFLTAKGLRDKLAEAAETALSRDAGGGVIPPLAFPAGTRLDSHRLDVISTYILGCSAAPKGQTPCKPDIAVRMRYDLATGTVTEQAIIRDIRDAGGNLRLPTLPGRGRG